MADNTTHPVSEQVDYRSLVVGAVEQRPDVVTADGEQVTEVPQSRYPFTHAGLLTAVQAHPLYAQILEDIDSEYDVKVIESEMMGKSLSIKESAELIQTCITLQNDADKDLSIVFKTNSHPEFKGKTDAEVEALKNQWKQLVNLNPVIKEMTEQWVTLGLNTQRTPKTGLWFWGRLSEVTSKYWTKGRK